MSAAVTAPLRVTE